MTILLTPPTSVPCPDWCCQEAGHGYECETSEGLPLRNHTRDFGSEGMTAAVVTEAIYDRGELLNAGPWIEVWVHGEPIDNTTSGDDRMTAEEARTLAAGLLEAAELLEGLEARG